MKVFSFECEECDSTYLKVSSKRTNCPHCREEMYMVAVMEVSEPLAQLFTEDQDE